VVHPKAALARDGFSQRSDRLLPQVFDRPAGGADQVVMMPRLTPDVSRHVPGPLQALSEASRNQRIERAKDGCAPDVSMLLANPLVEFLR
jgi:hypothetical protein